MPAEPYGAALTGPIPSRWCSSGCIGCDGRYGARCAATATGPTPGPPPPCGMQNVLCRLRCDTSPPNSPGFDQPEQGVEVGAVDVHLAAVLVHDRAQLDDARLVDAVGRRVGDHDRGQVVAVCRAVRAQVVEVDRAVVGRLDDDDAHAGHHGRRGVGAVRARRDQADVALLLAVGVVVAADREQPGQLALRSGVRLDRDLRVAGDLGQPALQLLDQLRRSPSASSTGANGCRSAKPGRLIGSISAVALSFIVHEPSGIIPRSSA